MYLYLWLLDLQWSSYKPQTGSTSTCTIYTKLVKWFLVSTKNENQKRNRLQFKCICTCDCWTFRGAVKPRIKAQQLPVQSTHKLKKGFCFPQKPANSLLQFKCICTCDCWTFRGAVKPRIKAQQLPVQFTHKLVKWFLFSTKPSKQPFTV